MFLHCLYFAFGMCRDLNWLEGLDAWNDDQERMTLDNALLCSWKWMICEANLFL